MLKPFSISLLIGASIFSSLANGQSNQVLQLEKSPRLLTFGEAAIAVPNSSDASHFETPTSGLVKAVNGAASYGAFSGKLKVEFDSNDGNGGSIRKDLKSDWSGHGLNLVFFTPLPTIIETGLLVTGGIQTNKIDFDEPDSVTERQRGALSVHGIAQVQDTTLTLSLNHQSEKMEFDSVLSATRKSSREGSVSYNSFGLGIRQEVSKDLSLAATYTPKSTKSFVTTDTDTDLDSTTNTIQTTEQEYKDVVYQNQTLSLAASLRLPDQNLTLAAGVSRLFPHKYRIDDTREEVLDDMTNVSMAAEMRFRANGIGLIPRIGIHNKAETDASLRSLQTGLAFDFGTLIADASLGYNYFVRDEDESDDSNLTVYFYSFALGLGMKI